jgi:multimeric flavodoxin WrbA
MKVVGVVGSPRHEMNTGLLVQKVLEGAKSQGVETDLFYLSDYKISPCRACRICKETRECVQNDDMKFLDLSITKAKVLILGTPIFLNHVSAQTKIFLDRLYPYLGPNLERRFPKGVKAVLVLTWGFPDPKAYDNVITWFQDTISTFFGIETIEIIKAGNTRNFPVSEAKDLLQNAFSIGIGLKDYSK